MKLAKRIIIYVVAVGFVYYIIDRVFNSENSEPPIKTTQPAQRYLPNGEFVSDEAVSLDVIKEWTKVYANQSFTNIENGLVTDITFIQKDMTEDSDAGEALFGTMELIQGSCIFTFSYAQRGNVIDATYQSSTCNRRKSSNVKIIINKEKKELLVEIGGQIYIFKPTDSLTTSVDETSGCYNTSNQKTSKCDICGFGNFDANGTCTHCDAITAEKERYYVERLPNCEACGGDGIEGFGRNQIICRICNGKGKQTY